MISKPPTNTDISPAGLVTTILRGPSAADALTEISKVTQGVVLFLHGRKSVGAGCVTVTPLWLPAIEIVGQVVPAGQTIPSPASSKVAEFPRATSAPVAALWQVSVLGPDGVHGPTASISSVTGFTAGTAILTPAEAEPGATETVPEVLLDPTVRPTVCGLPGALSETLSVAVCAPAVVGVKVTLMVQLELAPRVDEQSVIPAKSVLPVIATPVMVTAPPPVFESVTEAELLAPTWFQKDIEVGERLTAAAGGAVPVPLRLTVCGLPAALSATLSAPLLAPVAVGVNVTLMAQLDPAANEAPQLLV